MKEVSLESAGEAVRKLRQDEGLTLEQLAARLGWDKGRLSRYENNKTALSSSVIEQLAQVLGKDPALVLLRCLRVKYPALGNNAKLQKILRELNA